MRRICPICGDVFVSKAPRAKYCSPECVCKGQKLLRTRWNQEYPGYKHKYYIVMRDERRKQKLLLHG